MTNRIMAAVCLALVVNGQAHTQEPIAPPVMPRAEGDQGPGAAAEIGGNDYPADWRADRRLWVAADYLLGWIDGASLPPLVSTSPNGTDRAQAGILGGPTSILFGSSQAAEDVRSGVRLSAGYAFGPDGMWSIEVGASMLESQSTLFSAASDGSKILARPYISALDTTPQAVLVAFPGSSSGAIDARAASGNLYSGNITVSETFLDSGSLRLDSLLGYRIHHYDETLRIRQTMSPADPNFVPGTRIVSADDFGAQNDFHGFDLGVRATFSRQDLSLTLLGKVAVGKVNRDVTILGAQLATVPGAAPSAQTGGVLALSSNIGNYRSDDWTTVPEVGATLTWQATSNAQVRLGYSLLVLNDFARAASQIDLRLNPNLFPPAAQPIVGPNSPAFNLRRESVTVQSLTLGIAFEF